jgi:uncharacterized integral membrane protein
MRFSLCILTLESYAQNIDRYIIYLLTAIGLTPGGSSTVHIYTQTVHRTTQLIWEECGPCPVFANYTLAFTTEEKAWKKAPSV